MKIDFLTQNRKLTTTTLLLKSPKQKVGLSTSSRSQCRNSTFQAKAMSQFGTGLNRFFGHQDKSAQSKPPRKAEHFKNFATLKPFNCTEREISSSLNN